MFKTSLSLIIGGAIGNLIDRINLSYVIDFFDFRYINFAIFNTADSFVVVGTILLAYAIILERQIIYFRFLWGKDFILPLMLKNEGAISYI